MYKQIYEKIKFILVLPGKFWEREAEDEEKYDVAGQFVYPLLGLIALSAFIGYWIHSEAFDLAKALQVTCISFVAGFAGFFVASFLIDELSTSFLKIEKNINWARKFAGYSSIVFYLVTIFTNLLPSFFFVYLLLFYTVYIIWEGSDRFMKVDESKKLLFTVGATIIILGMPYLIEKILLALLPGAN